LNAIKGLGKKYPGIYKAIGLESSDKGRGDEESRQEVAIRLKLLELLSIESGVTQ